MKRVRCLAYCLGLLSIPYSMTHAQDEPPVSSQAQIVIQTDGGDGSDGPRVMSFQAIGSSDGALEVIPAFGGGLSFGGGNSTSLLSDDQIRRELELADEQLKQIEEIQKEMQREIADQVKQMHSEGGAFNINAMQEHMKEIRSQAASRIDDVLLPHQSQRLSQLRRHMRMRSEGDIEALSSGELAKELQLTDAQVERLKERAQEIEKELKEEIRQLQIKAKEKLFKELTPVQQKKLKELLGETFVYQHEDPAKRLRSLRKRIQESEAEKSDKESDKEKKD